ncbi:hypothetical protein ABT354_11230 [Streptomyces sp. NPDC000594]|uniref:hypothetical protein n=1 Tax=Streptomyces sp. NPDC000594 TaxID=3154261 RepID=UPI00332252BA
MGCIAAKAVPCALAGEGTLPRLLKLPIASRPLCRGLFLFGDLITTSKPARQTDASKKAEATHQPTTFEHGGVEYTVPAPLDMPVGLLDTEDEIEVIKLILGEQWAVYKATGATIRDFQRLAEKVAVAAGFGDPGN